MFPMENMPQMLAISILTIILFIGEFVSNKTKALIPSVFVCAVLFLLGYWTFFPTDIVSRSGIPLATAVLLMYLLIVNMGTLLSLQELMNQWKTVLISLSSIVGVVTICFIAGSFFFERNTIIVAIPPSVGGVVSSAIMAQGAIDNGLDKLAVFAVLIYVMHGFVGYPLTAFMLKREGKRVLEKYRAGQWNTGDVQNESDLAQAEAKDDFPQLFKGMPKTYNSSYFQLMRIAVVGLAAYYASELIKPVVPIHPLVICLLFGVIAKSIGFLEKHPLQKANAFGFAIMGLMLFIFDTLKRATPQMLADLIVPLVVFIFFASVGMYIFSTIAGHILKVSKNMAFAVALTALYGFPADYVITVEVINLLTTDPKERKVLTSHMLGPMLVGGFVSVTIVSVVLAGFMVSMLTPVGA